MAKVGLIKVVIGAQQCKKFSCMECAEVCPVGIVDKDMLREGISPFLSMAECTMCLRCVERCPYGAAKVRLKGQGVSPQRAEDFVAPAVAGTSREPSS
jgi:Fe-S-cluster-containing hydrogenase component 2